MPFDIRSLIPLIGGAGGALGHNPQGGSAFLSGWMQAKQAHEAELQRQQEQSLKQQENTRAQEQLKLQQAAGERAQQDQYLQSVNSVRQLLGDTSIETPEDYAQRESFVMNLAPKLGVDTGFVQSLRPKPDTFTRRKIQKVYDQFMKLPETERLMFEGGYTDANGNVVRGGHWNINGQMYTPAQAREALGIGGQTATGEPFVFSKPPKVDVPDTEFERYFEETYLPAEMERRQQNGNTGPLSRQDIQTIRDTAYSHWRELARQPQPAKPPKASNAEYNRLVKAFRDSMLFAARQPQNDATAVSQLRSRAGRLGLRWEEEVDRAARAAQVEAVKGARARDLVVGSGVAIPDVSAFTGRFGGTPPTAPAARGRGAGPGPANTPPPSARTATKADVQAVAERLGVPYAEAEKQLKARGVVLVGQ